MRAKTHRLAVVGRIAFPEAPEMSHTLILGPFSARGVLDTREKFLRATQGGSAARTAGQDLAWDSKKGTGKGRFMLAPAFRSARDAWNFFRPPEKGKRGAMNLQEDPPEHITEAVGRWSAGLWANEVDPHPACICGIGQRRLDAAAGYTRFGVPSGWCELHQADLGGRNRAART